MAQKSLVNRTKVELRKNDHLPIPYVNGVPSFTAKNLKAIPLLSEFDDEILKRLVGSFETKEVDIDKLFVGEAPCQPDAPSGAQKTVVFA